MLQFHFELSAGEVAIRLERKEASILILGVGQTETLLATALASENHVVARPGRGAENPPGATTVVEQLCQQYDADLVVLGAVPDRDLLLKELSSRSAPFLALYSLPGGSAGMCPLTLSQLGELGLPVIRTARVSNYSDGLRAANKLGSPPWAIWSDPPLEKPGAIVARYNDAVRHALLKIFGTHEHAGKQGTTTLIEPHDVSPEIGICLFADESAVYPVATYVDLNRVRIAEQQTPADLANAQQLYLAPGIEHVPETMLTKIMAAIGQPLVNCLTNEIGEYTGLVHLWLKLMDGIPFLQSYGLGPLIGDHIQQGQPLGGSFGDFLHSRARSHLRT